MMGNEGHGFGIDRLRPWSTYGFLKAVGVFYVTTALLHLGFFLFLGITDSLLLSFGVLFWPAMVPIEGIRLAFAVIGVIAGIAYYEIRRPSTRWRPSDAGISIPRRRILKSVGGVSVIGVSGLYGYEHQTVRAEPSSLWGDESDPKTIVRGTGATFQLEGMNIDTEIGVSYGVGGEVRSTIKSIDVPESADVEFNSIHVKYLDDEESVFGSVDNATGFSFPVSPSEGFVMAVMTSKDTEAFEVELERPRLIDDRP